MKSRGDRLEHRAVVDERGHQGALLHRSFRPTEVRRFGEGHSEGWMPVVDEQNNWKSHEALFRVVSAICGTKSRRQCDVQYLKEGGDHAGGGRSRVGLLEVHVGEGLAEKVVGLRVHAS